MAIGYLLIQARTAHDAVPLSGVQISVLDYQGNSVYELTTDESGETQRIPLETLDRSFSENPYFTGTPYINYNVLAQKTDFAHFMFRISLFLMAKQQFCRLHSFLCRK